METNWFSVAVVILFIQWEWSVSNCLVSAAVRVQWIVVTMNSADSVNSPKTCLFSCPHNCFKLTGHCCLPLVCWSFSWFNFSQMPSVQCVEVSNTPTVLVMYTTFESKLKARQLCLQAQSCNTTFESALKIKVRQVCFQADLAHDQLISPASPPPPPPQHAAPPFPGVSWCKLYTV